MNRVDSTIRIAAGVTVVGLAGIAGAISYSHMTHLAHLHGETGWRGHMFPLPVDGIEIVASLVLFADKHARRRSGGLPWAALISGTGASFAANMAVGGSDWIGRAVSGWPAFALLVAVKLLSVFSNTQSRQTLVATRSGSPRPRSGTERGPSRLGGTRNRTETGIHPYLCRHTARSAITTPSCRPQVEYRNCFPLLGQPATRLLGRANRSLAMPSQVRCALTAMRHPMLAYLHC